MPTPRSARAAPRFRPADPWRRRRRCRPRTCRRRRASTRRSCRAQCRRPLRAGAAPGGLEQLARPPDLADRFRNERLRAEARVDRHDEQQVEVGGDLAHAVDRRGRVHGDTRLAAQLLDAHHLAVQVRRGLDMDGQHRRARLGEALEVLLRFHDHEVHVERQRGEPSAGLDDLGAERQVRHEAAVHDVDVQPVGAAGLDHGELIGEAGEVDGQQGRRDAHGVRGQVGLRSRAAKAPSAPCACGSTRR